MAPADTDPQPYRRSQRRRALIGWLGGLLVLAAISAVLIFTGGGEANRPRSFKVPYGEEMTAADYEEINEGEEAADVLERLDASGRPESLTKPYVLVLFPKREEGDVCTYWEFSDEPRTFARLCFDKSSGELTQKLKHDVLHPPGGTGGQGEVV